MWLCAEWKIDWDAVSAVATATAAINALTIWIFDKSQRKRERAASAKLLLDKADFFSETTNYRLANAFTRLIA